MAGYPSYRRVAITLLILFFVGNSSAEIYKWLDEQGKVHYSDQPLGKNNEKVEVKSRVSDARKQDAERLKRRYQQLYQQIKEDEQAQAEADKKALAKKEKRQGYCDQLQKQVNIANQDYAFVRSKDDGGHEFLTDEEILAYRVKMNQAYADRCSDL